MSALLNIGNCSAVTGWEEKAEWRPSFLEAWCSSPLALENFVSLEVEAVHQAEEVGLVQVLEDPPRPVLQQLHTRTPGRRCYLSETNICQRRKRMEILRLQYTSVREASVRTKDVPASACLCEVAYVLGWGRRHHHDLAGLLFAGPGHQQQRGRWEDEGQVGRCGMFGQL